MTRRILALALFAAVPFAACDGCNDPLTALGDEQRLPPGNTLAGDRVLTYVGENPLVLSLGQTRMLRFTWKTTAGQPVTGADLQVLSQGDSLTPLNAMMITDSGGGVDVMVTAGDTLGDTTVLARGVDLDGSIDEDSVLVRVQEDPVAGLRVTVDSNARIDVVTADARVLAGTAPPGCAALLAGSPEPNAQLGGTFAPLPSTQDFTGLPTGARAVVVADGRNADGVVVARGCAETGALPGGVLTAVLVVLDQKATTLDGSYDVLLHMALSDALPSPYDETIELVTALLADPAGYAVYVTLRQIDGEVGTSFVTRNGVLMSYREIEQETLENPNAYPTWSFARAQLDEMLAQQLGQSYVDVTNVGAGIRDLATDFEVGARFALADDGADADASRMLVAESWQSMVLYWPLPCADGDLACARRTLTLADAELTPVTAEYGASSAFAPLAGHGERFLVTTDAHGLNVRYGAFLLAILEQVVFPSLPGGVAGDDFGDVLGNLVGCANIAASLSNDPVAQLFAQTLCEAGLDAAGQQIEEQLLSLEVGAVDPALGQQGLAAGGTFALLDDDQDLTTEIVDDYSFAVAWNDPADAAATQDISAPITGDGLRVLTACSDDTACALAGLAGYSCAARASYLKVAEVEYGCMRNKGDTAGGAACLGDDACASGLCAPVGVAGALQCFRACDAIADCGAGQICDIGGALDLDGVLAGLGTVELRGCSAP